MALLAQPAIAQNTSAPAAGASESSSADRENGIQDIVVTARYVAENIQDTPIAITAQTDEQLKAANVEKISDLGGVVPNMHTVPGDSMQAGSPTVAIRGVVQGGSSLAVPPAVGIYTDDVYHSTTAGSELDFTDVVRVEVNRGPQSTLSGNASEAGSIRIFTQDPKGDGSGFVSMGYGTRDHIDASGALDVGITNTLAVRGLAHFERQTGYVNRLDFTCEMNKLGTPALAGTLPYFQPDSAKKNCVVGHEGGGDRAYGQVKVQWKPVDNVRILLTGSHRENNLEETPEVALAYAGGCVNPIPGKYPTGIGPQPCGVTATNQVFALAAYNAYGLLLDNRFIAPARDGGIRDTYATFCRPKIDLTAAVPSVTAGAPPTTFLHNFQDGLCYSPNKTEKHTLLSGKLEAGLTDKINLTAIAAYTNYSNEFTQAADESPLGASISHFINLDKMYSGEMRVDGKSFNDKLQWVVGGFAVKTDGYQNNYISYGNDQQINSVHGINKSQSAFAHLDYNITDSWRVSGGGRYTHTDIAITIDNPSAVSVTVPAHSTQNVWDWLISTDYKVSEHAMVYATAASGSRPPGLTTIIANARQLSNTSDEKLISYEAGLKADMFDRRLRTNLTAFYLDYKKLSASAQGTQCANEPGTGPATYYNVQYDTQAAVDQCSKFPGNPVPVRYYSNVGIPASVRGIEWEITAVPTDGLKIDWTGGYNHFTSGAAVGKPGYLYPGNLRQPEWNMHADISYEIDPGFGTFTPRLDWTWQSKETDNPSSSVTAPPALFTINPYSIYSAQVVYRSPSRDWTATLQVSNLFDKYYNYIVYKGSVDTYSRVAPPREWMLTVRKNF